MPEIEITVSGNTMSAYVAIPEGEGPFPGVVVIHDALGMSTDLRNQADWLASEGYLAIAPDLFDGKLFLRCLRRMILDFSRREGPLFDKVESARQWLLHRDDCTDKVGLIGFCFGGGFALMLAPSGGYSAASVNYGSLPKDAEEFLKGSCPIVASYGAIDRTLKGAAEELESILASAGVDHDIKEYLDTDHAFMNNHDENEVPLIIKVISIVFGGGAYHPESAKDSQQRILAFFAKHLKASESS